MLSVRSYYRATLLLPLIACIVASRTDLPPEHALFGIRFILAAAWLPYIVFAGGLLVWSVERPASAIRRSLLLAPILFAPLVVFFSMAIFVFLGGPGALGGAVFLAGVGAAIGYAFVALVFGCLPLLRRVGLVEPAGA